MRRLEEHRATVDDLKQRVALGARVLGKLELADYLGHISARVPGTELFVVSPRGSKYGGLHSFRADDMLVLDVDRNVLEGTAPPPGEVCIHAEMYRQRPDVMGVVHDHQRLAVVFGITRQEIRPLLLQPSAVASRPIPVYDHPHMICTSERGQAVAKAIGDHRICHLRGHGIVAVGTSVEDAALNAINLELQARINLLSAQLVGLEGVAALALPPSEIEEFAEYQSPAQGGGGGAGAWKHYVSLLED